MKLEYLLEKCDSTDADSNVRHEFRGISDDDLSPLLQRARYQNWVLEKWKPFVGAMKPGDQLWRFRSPDETWDMLMGVSWYSIVRDGKILSSLVTMRS